MNRFTPIVQPYVVNPMSIEDLSRVPMAKAMAKASAVRAATLLDTTYNVDEKDLKDAENLINPIEQGKAAIIEEVMSTGVNSGTISKFIDLKRNYNVTKVALTDAERNKTRIDNWKEKVRTMHGESAYSELVRLTEYQDGWSGTFNKDAKGNLLKNERGAIQSQEFDKQYGPKYHDIGAEANATFGQIKATQVAFEKGKSVRGATPEVDAAGNVINTYYTTGEYSRMSNIAKLEESKKAMMTEYLDTNTEKGKFLSYMTQGKTEEEKRAYLDGLLEQVMGAYKMDEQHGGAKSTQTQSGGAATKVIEPSVVPLGEIPRQVTNVSTEKYSVASMEYKNKKKDGFIIRNLKNIGHGIKLGALGSNPYTPSDQLTEAQNSFKTHLQKSKEESAVAEAEHAADVKAIGKKYAFYAEAVQGINDSGMVDINGNPVVFRPSNSGNSYEVAGEKLASVIVKHDKDNSKLAKEGDILVGNMLQSIQNSTTNYQLYTKNVDAIEDLRDTKWDTKKNEENLVRVTSPQSVGVQILNVTNQELASSKDIGLLNSALIARHGGVTKESKWYAIPVGVGTSDGAVYRIDDTETPGKTYIPKGVAGGTVVDVYPVKNGVVDRDAKPMQFVVGPTLGEKLATTEGGVTAKSSAWSYEEWDNRVRAVGDIGVGEFRAVTYRTGGASIKGELGISLFEVPALTQHGEYVMAQPGEKLLYTEGLFPILYNENMFGNIEKVGDSALEETPLKEGSDSYLYTFTPEYKQQEAARNRSAVIMKSATAQNSRYFN